MNWAETGANDVLDQIHLYHQKARQHNKPIVYFATPAEMEVLKEGAGGDPEKLEWIAKNYRVYELMEEDPYVYGEKQTAPLNRADRRRIRYRKARKSLGEAKRT